MSRAERVALTQGLKLTHFAREVAVRKEMLAAGFCRERGISPGRVAFVERRTTMLVATWVEQVPLSPRRWWRGLLWRFSPLHRRRMVQAAEALRGLGLQAEHTVLFEEYAGPAPTCYFAERRRLQVVCRLCKRQVALNDWQEHVEKRHGGMA